jgi:Uma2 family endonuclease
MVRSADVSRSGAVVSEAFVERLERMPMSLEDYLALPEGRVEWVDGEAISMNAPPRSGHQRVARRLGIAIEDATGLFTVEAVGFWTLENRKSRIPDVMATRQPFDESWAPEVPVITVEILSRSTRSEDTIRKPLEYLNAGVAYYWVVDREQRELLVWANAGHTWDLVFSADADHPTGTVDLGELGAVDVDLDHLLRP